MREKLTILFALALCYLLGKWATEEDIKGFYEQF